MQCLLSFGMTGPPRRPDCLIPPSVCHINRECIPYSDLPSERSNKLTGFVHTIPFLFNAMQENLPIPGKTDCETDALAIRPSRRLWHVLIIFSIMQSATAVVTLLGDRTLKVTPTRALLGIHHNYR